MNESAETERVECPPTRDPAVRLFIFAGMLIAFGVWCFHDAFLRGKYPYPADGNFNDVLTHYFNHVGGIVLPLLGLIPLIKAILFLRRKLLATAEGIGYEGKTPVAWQDVQRLDAADLQDKGILRLYHGAAKPLVLDSWKVSNFKALVAFVESHVPPAAMEAAEQDAPPAAVSDDPTEPPDDIPPGE